MGMGESIYFAKDFDIILSKLVLCLLCIIFVYLLFLLDFHDFTVYSYALKMYYLYKFEIRNLKIE